MNILKDNFGRRFPYIRLSISDVCNFKCGYCLPDGYRIDKSDNRKFISKEEISRLAKAFASNFFFANKFYVVTFINSVSIW